MTIAQLEQRLTALEQKFAAMTQQNGASHPTNVNAWIDEIHGTFQDDETYRKAARLGKEWRKAQRPSTPRTRKAPRR